MYGIDLILPQILEVAGTFSCLTSNLGCRRRVYRNLDDLHSLPYCQLQGPLEGARHGEKTNRTGGSRTWPP